MNKIPDLTINEALYDLPGGKKGKIAVFIYSGGADPKRILDLAITSYVGDNGYHELIDANLDNPWMKVVISNINDMDQHVFEPSEDKLSKEITN